MNVPGRRLRSRQRLHLDHRRKKAITYVPVWDRFVRIFHWSLVLCFFTAYFSTEGPRWLHLTSGFIALELVVARLFWGFGGQGHALFSRFVPGPRQLARYLAAMVRGEEPRCLGHNPAAAVMILFLLAMVAGIGATGWMMTTDAWWGNGTVETLHVVLVDVTIAAVVVHVSAAIYESLRHRDNLILAMITGYKKAEPDAKAAAATPDEGVM